MVWPVLFKGSMILTKTRKTQNCSWFWPSLNSNPFKNTLKLTDSNKLDKNLNKIHQFWEQNPNFLQVNIWKHASKLHCRIGNNDADFVAPRCLGIDCLVRLYRFYLQTLCRLFGWFHSVIYWYLQKKNIILAASWILKLTWIEPLC